jgi:hypothetical protein
MTFSERMIELLEQGIAASKDLASKAGAKAQDLGERGILMLEIKQLESQAQKLIGRMGNETYRVFVDENRMELLRDSPEISEILAELARVRDIIEKKEAELKARKTQ